MSEPEGPKPSYPVVVRWTHWINAFALLLLVGSGLQIFNAHPALYAADASDPRHVVLALPQAFTFNSPPVLFGQRLRWLPLPENFGYLVTLGGWLEGARRLHFAAAWLFLLNGVLYLGTMLASRRKRAVWPFGGDYAQLWPSFKAHFRFPPELHGPGGTLNPLQKLSYALLALVVGPLVIATGLALSPQWDAIFPFWTVLFGGRQFARTWHFVAMLGLVAFTIGHIGLVAASGPSTLKRMLLGDPKGAPRE
ncbi:MAG TPA: cytochrome b/b6 domain-containing protein [Oscillatoriaceae cyanobacterium]